MDALGIRRRINEDFCAFVENSPLNALSAYGGQRIYGQPLFGVAAANDPLFRELLGPGVVGPNFLLPKEWLPRAKTVLSYFLPFTEPIRDSNRESGPPSPMWITAKIDGEAFNEAARAYLAELLEKEYGARAVAPCIDPRFRVAERISNWSERHAAYVAGLGTFGLHRALITAKGTAGRFGSVVTTLELPPAPRPYANRNEYCLYLTKGTCGACMRRCPARAITEEGKDHVVCENYIDDKGCAKCNIGVPCEHGIPAKRD